MQLTTYRYIVAKPDHAGIQSSLRKLANIADSITTNEVVIPVDSIGRVILGGSVPSNEDNGWFTSRGLGTQSGPSAPQKYHQLSVLHRFLVQDDFQGHLGAERYHQLSVLHRLSWFRMIFKDIWGQKGGAISFLYLLV